MNGREWETRIDQALSAADRVERTHTIVITEAPMLVIKGRPVRKSKGMLDFEGCYGGKHVALDAKLISEDRLNFKSKIKDHQVQRIMDTLLAGGAAGLLVRFDHLDEQYGWHGREMLRMIAAGHKSVKHSEMMDQGAMSIRDDLMFWRFMDEIVRTS